MSNKISVKSGIIVEVNDNGDTITVNVDDQLFIERFRQLTVRLDEIKQDVQGATVKGEKERLQFYIEKIREIMAEMDALFGEGCCRKVFGDIVPSPFLIADFFEQMIPVIEEYTKVRKADIAKKYSRQRKGGRKS